jgi:iron(III) transport system permease protein
VIPAALRAARLWSVIGLGAACFTQLPQILLLVALAALVWWPQAAAMPRRRLGSWLAALAGTGFAFIYLQAYAAPVTSTHAGIGVGDAVTLVALLFCATSGLALRGAFRGDAFTAGAAWLSVLLVLQFTLVPLLAVLAAALKDADGAWSLASLAARLSQDRLWSLACLAVGTGGTRCGVAWNTLFLALLTAGGCTLLGLAFALVVTRTGIPMRRAARLLTVLPIVTPPFVIGMGLILIFGRAGVANQLLEWAFGLAPSRWIYGLPGVLLAQLFAFTPVAFLVLVGVVEGVSPTLEEAAQTLRADPARTFRTVSLPLMRPGIANAFLISFIESIADFGNPIVLGGNFGVLSTEIYFSIVGAQLDQGRAAALALVLLAFALAAFGLQRRVLGGRSFVTVTGKGDSGLPVALPAGARRAALALVLPWMALTLVVYALALVGGFVETWGRDYTLTLKHFVKAFDLTTGAGGLVWSGAAWNSFWTTVALAAIAAPLTAGLGLLVAWLIARQPFRGRGAFEFMTLLSFAIPGTIIGIAYVIAFNVPPIEITGTALVIVLCLVFRNLPVGVRAGVAAMSQLDRSLDEASLTLRATGGRTLVRVVLPLLRPAIAGALVYSFVRAMTTVSAVIFLVSAEYDLATAYIIGRVINGDYGVALAYCTVLILLMVAAIVLIQWLVGARRPGRPAAPVALGQRA